LVYNLRFAHRSGNPDDHVFLANGIVVGDYWLQDLVAERRRGCSTRLEWTAGEGRLASWTGGQFRAAGIYG
jgi:hypothetical protein